jgi:hypothetical protein
MSEGDAIDAMIERAAREEQDAIDRAHGQHIIEMMADRRNAEDPLMDALRRAYEAKAEEE